MKRGSHTSGRDCRRHSDEVLRATMTPGNVALGTSAVASFAHALLTLKTDGELDIKDFVEANRARIGENEAVTGLAVQSSRVESHASQGADITPYEKYRIGGTSNFHSTGRGSLQMASRSLLASLWLGRHTDGRHIVVHSHDEATVKQHFLERKSNSKT